MKKFIPFVAVGSLFLTVAFFVSAATSSPAPAVSFPVPELGNCSSKADCHAYCAQTDHMAACADFAQTHGLQSKEQAESGKKFAQLLQNGGGPGGCQTPGECQSFCNNLKNLDACLAFAKSNGFDTGDPNVQAAEKIQSFLQSGGRLPGGCSSQDSCQSYCSDFSHLQECISFMKSANLQPEDSQPSGHQQLTTDQLTALAALIAGGQTPQGCDSQQSCQRVCSGNPAHNPHRDECLKFGEALGLITSEQAQQLMQSPAGPGGCSSPNACEQYCNETSHQQECLQFAKEHGFINDQDSQNIQNAAVLGQTDLLNQASPGVLNCIVSTVGQAVVDQIKSGQLPNPNDAEKIKTCFQKDYQAESPQELFNHLPDRAMGCIAQKIGQDGIAAINNGTLPNGDQIAAIKSCVRMPLPSPLGAQQGNHPEDSPVPPPPPQSPEFACLPDHPDTSGCIAPLDLSPSPLQPSQPPSSPEDHEAELPPPTSSLYNGIQGLLKTIGL